MNTGRALAYLLHYKPEYWFELVNKFDQDGTFRRKLNIDTDDNGNVEMSSPSSRQTRSAQSSFQRLYQKITETQNKYSMKLKSVKDFLLANLQ